MRQPSKMSPMFAVVVAAAVLLALVRADSTLSAPDPQLEGPQPDTVVVNGEEDGPAAIDNTDNGTVAEQGPRVRPSRPNLRARAMQANLATSLQSALASAISSTRSPGAQAAVYQCGTLVWQGSAGVGNRAASTPITADSLFVLASCTKTYVATMIMSLVQEGRLTLSTPLSTFYPAFPNAASITIRMLLTHTSGLGEYDDSTALDSWLNDPRHVWTRAQVLSGIGAAQFAPGARYEYTNSNYIVLGGILEIVTGQTVEQLLQGRVCTPAGLTSTSFTTPSGSTRFAHPYSGRTDLWVPGYGVSSDTLGPVWTDGGIATTATELAKFGDALHRGRIVSSATVTTMTSWDRWGTGLGLFYKSFGRRTWVGHDGSYGGYESEMWFDRSRGLTVAIVVNQEDVSETIWNAVTQALNSVAPSTWRQCV